MIEVEAQEAANMVIDEMGNTAYLYSPTITYNDEGDRKIELGTPKSILVLTFDVSGEELSFKIEGVDMTQTYNAYIKSDEPITKQSILKIGDSFYKILSIAHTVFQDIPVYHRAVITKTKFDEK